MNQLESFKEINKKLSNDLTIIEKAYKEVLETTDKITKAHSNDNYAIVTLSYSLWVKFTFSSEKEYEEFLVPYIHRTNKGYFGSDIFMGMEVQKNEPNSEALHLIDKMNFYLKHLHDNFEVKLPSSLINESKNEISIIKIDYHPKRALKDLNTFITRVDKMINHLEEISLLDGVKLKEVTTNDWLKKLSKNKFQELFSEMINFFRNQNELEKLKIITQLSQRYNILKTDSQKGIRPQENLDSERNKISSALIDIIYEL